MTKANGTFINSPWHLAVAVRISLGASPEITGFLLHRCIMHAGNGSVVSVHGRPGAPLLHVICNASVQWALFLVKSNYLHKTEPRASRLPTKKNKVHGWASAWECVCVWVALSVCKAGLLRSQSNLIFFVSKTWRTPGLAASFPPISQTLMWGMGARKIGIQRFNTNSEALSEIMEPRFIWLDEECSGQLQRPW